MFLKNIFFKIIEVYNYFVNPFRIRIQKVSLTYTHDGSKRPNYHLSRFWNTEKRYWLRKGEDDYHWTDITYNFKDKSILTIPKHVRDVIFRIKYIYCGKKYICLNSKPLINSILNKDMKFFLPLHKVYLLNSKIKTLDVTKKYIKYLGPKNNFHNYTNNLTIENLFPYENYDSIEITNIAQQTRTFPKETILHLLL
jgi:hypothetical protein